MNASSDMLSFPLARWVMYRKLRIMEWIIQIGFEQELYRPDELAGMYLLLKETAYGRIDVLKDIKDFISVRYERLQQQKKNQKAEDVLQIALFIESSLWEARGIEALADALYLVRIVLELLD
jgi:N-alpha-acetyltransferase 35, NatC auxiliary subunit